MYNNNVQISVYVLLEYDMFERKQLRFLSGNAIARSTELKLTFVTFASRAQRYDRTRFPSTL